MKTGPVAGYQVVDVCANCMTVLTTKSTPLKWHSRLQHPWHSRMLCKKAAPVLLEPIFKVEVTVPENYMGDIIGDISSRRGRIEGMADITTERSQSSWICTAVRDVRIRYRPAFQDTGTWHLCNRSSTISKLPGEPAGIKDD